jgi:hypothetical protein
MRKLMVAVAAVAGLALTAGCKRNPQEERRELAQTQQEAQKKIAEAHKDANEERADIRRDEQDKVAKAQRDVNEEQRDVLEADRERANDTRSGYLDSASISDTVQGSVQSTKGDSLVLRVPTKNNAELKLKTDGKTRVTQDNRNVDLDDFHEGTEVRASYVTDGDDLVARDVVIITPLMKK